MKVAHFGIFAPHASGQFETIRDLVAAEKLAGMDAGFIDYGHKGKPNSRVGLKDKGLETLPVEWATDADILVRHSAVPQELESLGTPVITALHGRPESSFLLEHYGKANVISELKRARKKKTHAGFLTFWTEFIFPWSEILEEEVLYVPAPLDLSRFLIKEGHKFEDLGSPNIVVADLWREDTTPFNVIMAAAFYRRYFNEEAKVHLYGVPRKKSMNVLMGLKNSGTLGEVVPQIKNLNHVLNGADILVTPHVIATRIIREAMAVRLPFVAGKGCEYTSFSANPRNIQAYAAEIGTCWASMKLREVEDSRELAEAEFGLETVGLRIGSIFEKVLHNHTGPRWNAMSIVPKDWDLLKSTIEKYGVKSLVEFGAGVSTQLFDSVGVKVKSFETMPEIISETKRRTSEVVFELWDGKTAPKISGDMAFIDGPHGGKNREPAYQAVAESPIPIVACHDVSRAEDRVWVDKYFKDWKIISELENLQILERPGREGIKLAIVYDVGDHKLQDTSYSWIYKGMLDAIVGRFENVTHIHNDCDASDIEADVILFYDIHSTHHIKIDGIANHPALKLEYWTDPNQVEFKGMYKQFNKPVHKLGRKQRVERALERGVRFIICPFREGYYKWLGEFLSKDAEDMLLYFPLAPTPILEVLSLSEKQWVVLGNGATHGGEMYEFRNWAFKQPYIKVVPHWINDNSTPSGMNYLNFLSNYAGVLGLHDYFPVPKYFEIPAAGCVLFAQHYKEFEELGFKDYEHCIYVNKENFEERIRDFLSSIQSYQSIADAGIKLVGDNYTAKHFANFVYDKVAEELT